MMITKMAEDLAAVRQATADMGAAAVSLTARAIRALQEDDEELAQTAADDYPRLAQMNTEIEVKAIRILLLYQPAAEDARMISTVLESISHMERIGKNAKSIAEIVLLLDDQIMIEPFPAIERMGNTAETMIRIAVDGFTRNSVEGFDRLRELDGILDVGRRDSYRDATEHIKQCPDSVDVYTQYLFVTRYLERMGDHACDMAEKVAFMVTGRHIEIDG